MPRDQNQSATAYHYYDMDQFPFDISQLKRKPKAFKKKISKYGIDAFRLECLVLRFVYDMSYQQIADNLHSPTKWVAFDAVKSALQMLRERGFKK